MTVRGVITKTEQQREPSEFGAGVVVCLAKFSEHLWNWSAERFMHALQWSRMTEDQREQKRAEAARFPRGDAARLLGTVDSVFGVAESVAATMGKRYDETDALSRSLMMWANGASDHFYDLDRDKAPAVLCELADLTLEMGHGFTEKTWTEDDWRRIRDLWQESCLAIDAALGSEPDWGQW